jgi:hypothetical protein
VDSQRETRRSRDISQSVRDRRLVQAALDRAARHALLRDRQLGLSVPVWRNGRTEWIPPEQIDALLAQTDHKTDHASTTPSK